MEGRRYMKDIALIGVTALLACGIAMAQSSGNFTYGNTGTTHCVLNSNGTITGGTTCSAGTCSTSADCATGQTCGAGVCTGGCVGSLKSAIKTNSGSGNVFVVRPSAVI